MGERELLQNFRYNFLEKKKKKKKKIESSLTLNFRCFSSVRALLRNAIAHCLSERRENGKERARRSHLVPSPFAACLIQPRKLPPVFRDSNLRLNPVARGIEKVTVTPPPLFLSSSSSFFLSPSHIRERRFTIPITRDRTWIPPRSIKKN